MRAEWCVVALLLSSGPALAQDTQAGVVPFPLEVKSAGTLQEKDFAELQATWRRLLRAVALVPDTGTVETALSESGRRDCEREDECLKVLALKARTLYAAYGSLSLDVTRTKVVGTGRVVRDDGAIQGGIRTVTVELGSESFLLAGKRALGKLVDELEVSKLSPVRPAAAPRVAGDAPPPPPVVVAPERAPPVRVGRTGLLVTMGAGVAVAVTGLGLAISAASDEARLKIDAQGRITGEAPSAEAAERAKTLGVRRGLGAAFIAVGAVAAGTGFIIFMATSGDEKVMVRVTPAPGGLSVGGTW